MLSRGVPAALRARTTAPASGTVRIRQAAPPDLELAPREADGALDATLVARRRGRHELPAPATRTRGPLGLATWDHRVGTAAEVSVYPDLAMAWRIARSVREGRFREQGVSARGPLGLGTDFELVRDYLPDDDVRQVNWRATARLGRPMSNQYRVEQDRDVVVLVDAGRLSAAALPLAGDAPGRPRGTVLDAALDVLAAVALVADEVGDRCGAIAFDDRIRAALAPRRRGGAVVVRALHDLEPRLVDADHAAAFRRVEGAKRAFVLILSDLLEPVAARSLAEAVPVLAKRHVVVVASPEDPGLAAAAVAGGGLPLEVAAATMRESRDAAVRVVRARRRAGRERAARPPRARVRDRLPAGEVARRAVSAAGPRDEPPEQRGEADADPGLDPDGQLRPRGQPLEEAAEHEPRGGADGELHGAPPLLLQRAQPRVRAGTDEREPEPQAGDAADGDARELERPVRGDQADERLAVARTEGQPADDPEQEPVETPARRRCRRRTATRPRTRPASPGCC